MKAEWGKLTAREKDAKVAEVVMEWVAYDGDVGWYEPVPMCCNRSDCGCMGLPTQPPEPVAHYTTDGNAMLQVIDKMRERGWDCEILLHNTESTAWPMVGFGKLKPKFQMHQGRAKTLPEAVALAAVLAVEKGRG